MKQLVILILSGIILGSLSVMAISFFALPVISYQWLKKKEKEWGESGMTEQY